MAERPPGVALGADDPHLPSSAGPSVPVRVHHERLERRVTPLALSPAEALRLATEGRSGLSRRGLPPDPAVREEHADDAGEG